MVPASGAALDLFMQGAELLQCGLVHHYYALSFEMKLLYHHQRLVDQVLWCLAWFATPLCGRLIAFVGFAFGLGACAGGPWPVWHNFTKKCICSDVAAGTDKSMIPK